MEKNFMNYGWRSIITRDYKLAVSKGMCYGEERQVYLYDLQQEPDENHNLKDKVLCKIMMKELEKWCITTGDHFMDLLNSGRVCDW